MTIYKKILEEYFLKLEIDLNNKDLIEIHNDQFYRMVLNTGFLGLAESYMAGHWDSKCLDGFLYKVFLSQYDQKIPVSFQVIGAKLFAKVFNLQSVSRAFQIGRHHYDIGNDLYKLMLDKELIYTCAYWKNAETLDQAQEHKLDLICRKLNLEKGMKILDIGCGWGGFARYACRNYGVEVDGYTVSVEQKKLADELNKGLPIKIHLQDYREISSKYDRVVVIGMIEHVGYKNYDTFFKKVASSLTQDGLALIHTVGSPYSQTSGNIFINKYIFPNSMAPSIAQISKAVEHIMIIEDLHNIGPDYDLTLMAWYNNFIANWDQLKGQYTEEFKRMWEFYLLGASANFRARDAQLWQIVLSKPGAKQLNIRQS